MNQLALAIATTLPILRGAFVRSWDSPYPERRTWAHSWIEGFVVNFTAGEHDDCQRYAIRVTADYCDGKAVRGEGSRVGSLVFVPVNGSEALVSGRVADGVEYRDEIPTCTWEWADEEKGYIKAGRRFSVNEIVGALSARLTAEDLIDEYDALGLYYRYDRRGPDGLIPPMDPNEPIKSDPIFEVSVATGGSEGHHVQVRMRVDVDGVNVHREYCRQEDSVVYKVKTFAGFEGAFRIAKRITALLGC